MLAGRWRTGRLALLAAALTLTFGPGAALAQVPPDLPAPPQRLSDVPPCTRIVPRVRGTSVRLPGTLVRVQRDTLWMVAQHRTDTTIVLTSTLSSVDVFNGWEDRSIGRGAVRGLLIGAGIGAVAGAVIASGDEEGADFFGGPAGMAAMFAAAGAVPGVLIGAIGSLGRREVWLTVGVP